MMWTITILLFYTATTMLLAQGASNKDECPLTVANIESVFGKGFGAGETYKTGDILSCKFSNKDYSIQISINSAYGMKIDDYNKMMSPATVIWKPIPNDPDQARIEIRDEKKDNLAGTPCITLPNCSAKLISPNLVLINFVSVLIHLTV